MMLIVLQASYCAQNSASILWKSLPIRKSSLFCVFKCTLKYEKKTDLLDWNYSNTLKLVARWNLTAYTQTLIPAKSGLFSESL